MNQWAKTQPDGGPAALMDCGIRAFDWRPQINSDGSIIMHHGGVKINHPMSDALDAMVAWANNHTAVEDIVILYVTDTAGGDQSNVISLLASKNITSIANCSDLKGLTVADAAERGQIPGGGAILAVPGCLVSNYDPSVACSGFGDGSIEYTCYADSSSKSFPLNRMWAYLDKVASAGPPADGSLFTSQGIWQESTDSVIVGETHLSSLLLDETRSQLNSLLAQRMASGVWNVSRAGIVEINNACDGGVQLLEALRKAT